MIEVYDTGWVGANEYNESNRDGMKITNPDDGSLILEIATQWYDDYYPMACFSYHPENMPGNKKKPLGTSVVKSQLCTFHSKQGK